MPAASAAAARSSTPLALRQDRHACETTMRHYEPRITLITKLVFANGPGAMRHIQFGETPSGKESPHREPRVIQVNVNDRSEEQRHDLREEKPANYRYAESSS